MATVAQLRILCQDPAGEDQLIDDASYDLAIELGDNTFLEASIAARMIAAKLSVLVDMGGGSSSIKLSQKVDHYNSLADSWETKGTTTIISGSPILTGINEDTMEAIREDTERYNSTFYRGVLDGD